MEEIFKNFEEHLNKKDANKTLIKEESKKLDNIISAMNMLYQKIHLEDFNKKVEYEIYEKSDILIEKCGDILLNLSNIIPENEYFNYNNLFTNHISILITFLAMQKFLSEKKLITVEEVTKKLNIPKELKIGIDEYLIGICNLTSELSRYSINCVIRKDYQTPKIVGTFLNELYSGLKLLNLKNDGIRKRFDAIKYDIKKVEEINYDLSIRELN